MPHWTRTTTLFMIFSLAFGGLLAAPRAARADDKPIVGPIIIKKDPPKPQPKGGLVPAGPAGY